MKKKTVHFKSRSTDEVYKTARHRDGKITCFCPGYVYQGKCWQVEQAKNYVK